MPPSDELLQRGRVAHLATADREGRPHVIPVCFAFVDGVVYTPLDLKPKRSNDPRHLRRVRNVLANRRAALVIDHYEEDWSRLSYVLVEGEAELIVDPLEEERAAAALRAKYEQYRDVPIVGMLKLSVDRTVSWP